MDMDAMEEFSAGSNNTIDQTMIMKGKRTKRQRPLSPVGRVMTSSSSSGGGGRGGRGGESGCSDDYHYNFSAPSVGEIYSSSTTDQEDEDMAANCLILLAQGRCGGGGRSHRIKPQEDEEEESKIEKLISSRKINEMISTASATATTAVAAKSGLYVYECKTCNRTFPSFQALGGHRASHKKPKPSTAAEEKKVAGVEGEEGELAEVEESSEEEEKGKQSTIIATAAPNSNSNPNPNPNPNEYHSSQLSMDQLPFSNKLVSSHGNNNNKSSKIHECSICGSEFSSGQALGGHMRRHRNPTTTTTTTKPAVDHHSGKKSSDSNIIFPLDLNLPAPEDHDHRDLKFQYATNQQPHLVFSASALVDCHY